MKVKSLLNDIDIDYPNVYIQILSYEVANLLGYNKGEELYLNKFSKEMKRFSEIDVASIKIKDNTFKIIV